MRVATRGLSVGASALGFRTTSVAEHSAGVAVHLVHRGAASRRAIRARPALVEPTGASASQGLRPLAGAAGLCLAAGPARYGQRSAGRQGSRYLTRVAGAPGGVAPAVQLQSPVFSVEIHGLAREALLERFRRAVPSASSGVLFFAGGQDSARHDTDHEDIFRQESTFHYLFGVREPGFWGVIDVESGSATLFMPSLPAEYAVWFGEIKRPQKIRELYEVEDVVFADSIKAWFAKRMPSCIYVQRGRNPDSKNEVVPAFFAGMRELYSVDENVLHDLVYECRAHKNQEELRLLRYVNRVSADAHIEVMRQTRPGLMEYQLESMFAYYCYYNGGCRLMSYTPIAASGPNSAVLHYGHAGAPNDRRLEDGDMVLLDMGSELFCYASDITNSFPASGSFTPDQRLVFDTVAAMQRNVLNAMGPGVNWVDMQELAYRTMCKRLLDGGLLIGDVDAMMAANVGGALMPHGLGHLLGIDTHDVGGYPRGAVRDTRDGFKSLRCQRALERGMVITVEPGVYFIAYALDKAKADPELSRFFNWGRVGDFASFGGVRLENNVVITEHGIEDLTVAPRTVEEVEAVMRGEIADSAALAAWRWDKPFEKALQ